jgi:hypothetical protein
VLRSEAGDRTGECAWSIGTPLGTRYARQRMRLNANGVLSLTLQRHAMRLGRA